MVHFSPPPSYANYITGYAIYITGYANHIPIGYFGLELYFPSLNLEQNQSRNSTNLYNLLKRVYMARSRKNMPKAYILAPKQSLAQYKQLEREWYGKIHAKGFLDIEFLDSRGYSSPFTRDYSLAMLQQAYSPAAEEYFRRASIFLHEFEWGKARFKALNPGLARFIWEHYAAGFTLRQIVKAVNGTGTALNSGPRPRRRNKKGQLMSHPSLFWIHLKLKEELLPAFEAWIASNSDKLEVDWVLNE